MGKAHKADQRGIRRMCPCVSILFLFIGLTSAAKQGDFGIFEPCITKNATLRLRCYYARCPGSASFTCRIIWNATMDFEASGELCEYGLPHASDIKNYTCILTRRKRIEEKKLNMDHARHKDKKALKPCVDTTGLLLHRAPTLLWPVIVSLWRLLIADS